MEYVNKSPYKLGQFGEQLENMTEQEVFDIACEHLILQGKKSEDSTHCLYNGNGVCCVAAPFILDYYEGMESLGWNNICHSIKHLSLIVKLQNIHDGSKVNRWVVYLKIVASDYGLTLPKILIKALKEV